MFINKEALHHVGNRANTQVDVRVKVLGEIILWDLSFVNPKFML